MILPTKRLSIDRSLLFIGSEILGLLNKPKTVSQLWVNYRGIGKIKSGDRIITFDVFSLALDFLFTIGAVDLIDSKVRRTNNA